MGIVQRQSLKNSIVNYLGIGIGVLSTLFIYPLDWSLYGKIQFCLSASLLLRAFFALGSQALPNKFAPFFRINKLKGFLSLLLTYSTINILLFSIFLFIFYKPFLHLLELGGFDPNQINENLFLIIPLSILLVYIAIFRGYCFNLKRIVVPDLISNFSLKIIIPLLVLLSYFQLFNFKSISWVLIIAHLVMILTLMVYIKRLDALDFDIKVLKRIKKNKHIEMIRYMLYGALNHVGNILVYKIDLIMIGLLLQMDKVGYYSIFLFLSTILDVPSKAIIQISGPMISENFDKDNLQSTQKLYRDSAVNLYIVGILLFIGIWLNMNTLFTIMTHGEELMVYKTMFLILALTKLLDMVTSINSQIISYSKYYRVNTLFLIILAFSNILLNYFFIETYGIFGAALATAISMVLFNILKTVFIMIRYKIHPFDKRLSFVTLFLLVAILLPIMVPVLFESILLSILISGSLMLLFVVIVYQLKISKEINNMIDKYWVKFIK